MKTKAQNRRKGTPAGRKPAAKTVTVTLELDQIHLDQLLLQIESLANVRASRGEVFITKAVAEAIKMLDAGNNCSTHFALLKLAPVYRALLTRWRGSRTLMSMSDRWDHTNAPGFPKTRKLAINASHTALAA
jgi:hypothetical protein